MDNTATAEEQVTQLLVASEEPMSPQDIADALDIEYSYVRKVVRRLTEQGVIENPSWGKYTASKQPLPTRGALVSLSALVREPIPHVSTSLAPKRLRTMRSVVEETVEITVYFEPTVQDDGTIIYRTEDVYRINEPLPVLEARFRDRPPSVMGLFINRSDWAHPKYRQGDFIWYGMSDEPIRHAGYYAVMLDGALEVKRVEPRYGGAYRLIPENKLAGYEPILIEPTEEGGVNYVTGEGRPVLFKPVGPIIHPSPDEPAMDREEVAFLLREAMQAA